MDISVWEEVSVQDGLCPGMSLSRGFMIRGCLSREGSLSRDISVQGRVSVQGHLCPGASLSRGISVQGRVSVQGGL